MGKSEFGRGYATALIQFSFHRPRLAHDEKLYERMRDKDPTAALFTPAHTAEMFMNGASDHLYDLVHPKSGLGRQSWREARTMADRALDIGHGFGLRGQPPSDPDECRALLDTADRLLANIDVKTFDQALKWDTEHGLKPDPGTWSCKVPR